jgi:hypothetical protein
LIVIGLSKIKLVVLLLLTVAGATLCVWLGLVVAPAGRHHPLLVGGIASAGFTLCALSGMYVFRKLLDGRPGLVIDAEGIIDNASAVSAGRVPWQDIVRVEVASVGSQRFLTVLVADPRKYVGRGGRLHRWVNAANATMTGSPINISSGALRIEFDELVRLMTESLETHQRRA